jgi:catechol 2,3-dioxygenase-like lactoylglutathione lyase family enzyme
MKTLRHLLLTGALLVSVIPPATATQNAIGIKSLGHVGIAVSNVQRALHFYVGQLGLREVFRLNRPDGRPRLIYLQVGDSSTFVELFPGTRSPSSPQLPKPYHFGFFVNNLQHTLHELQTKGYLLPTDAFERARKVQADGTFLYFIFDPDGHRIELSQATPRSYQGKAAPALLGSSSADQK